MSVMCLTELHHDRTYNIIRGKKWNMNDTYLNTRDKVTGDFVLQDKDQLFIMLIAPQSVVQK